MPSPVIGIVPTYSTVSASGSSISIALYDALVD